MGLFVVKDSWGKSGPGGGTGPNRAEWLNLPPDPPDPDLRRHSEVCRICSNQHASNIRFQRERVLTGARVLRHVERNVGALRSARVNGKRSHVIENEASARARVANEERNVQSLCARIGVSNINLHLLVSFDYSR